MGSGRVTEASGVFRLPAERAGRARRGIAIARSASGVVLIGMGILLVTNLWLPLMAPLLRWYAQAQWPPV